MLKKTGNEHVSEKFFTKKELDELITEKSDRELVKKILELLQDSKAEEIVLIDVRENFEWDNNDNWKLWNESWSSDRATHTIGSLCIGLKSLIQPNINKHRKIA